MTIFSKHRLSARQQFFFFVAVVAYSAGNTQQIAPMAAPKIERSVGMFIGSSGSTLRAVECFSGHPYTIILDASSKVVIDSGPGRRIDELHPGDLILVGRRRAGGKWLASYILVNTELAAHVKERLGRTANFGTVTRTDARTHHLTLRRIDGVSQELEADSSNPGDPNFRKFAELRVGDRIAARGVLDHGVFRVTVMRKLSEEDTGMPGFE